MNERCSEVGDGREKADVVAQLLEAPCPDVRSLWTSHEIAERVPQCLCLLQWEEAVAPLRDWYFRLGATEQGTRAILGGLRTPPSLRVLLANSPHVLTHWLKQATLIAGSRRAGCGLDRIWFAPNLFDQ